MLAQAPTWVEKAANRIPELRDKADPALRDRYGPVGEVLIQNKTKIKGMLPALFAAVTCRIAMGHYDDAKALWLREHATFAQRMAERDAASQATRDEAMATADAFEQLAQVSREVVRVGGQVAIPLLFSVIG